MSKLQSQGYPKCTQEESKESYISSPSSGRLRAPFLHNGFEAALQFVTESRNVSSGSRKEGGGREGKVLKDDGGRRSDGEGGRRSDGEGGRRGRGREKGRRGRGRGREEAATSAPLRDAAARLDTPPTFKCHDEVTLGLDIVQNSTVQYRTL